MAIARATAAPAPAAKRFPDITADIAAVGSGTALRRTGAEAGVDGRRDS
jgi:hypothetical protein